MNGETISRAQLLLQYYTAMAELELEGPLMASHASKSSQNADRVDRMGRAIVGPKEMRATA